MIFYMHYCKDCQHIWPSRMWWLCCPQCGSKNINIGSEYLKKENKKNE